jgi:epoxyqueuosine reductase
MQFNKRIAHGGAGGQAPGEGRGGVLVQPNAVALGAGLGRGFYNRWVTFNSAQIDPLQLLAQIQTWAGELGFSQIGVAGVDLSSAEPGLMQWLAQGFHGSMDYMAAHGLRRARPSELVPGTASVITARMDYLPRSADDGALDDWQAVEFDRLQRPAEGIVSVYARGRDYHKVLRARLQKLQTRIAEAVGPFGHRVFTDSAPVLEAELAARSGQGWRGKHTLVLSREAGSMFFLGEIYVDLALPPSAPVTAHCGSCQACIDICPTQAIIAPYRLDARRCISYLTIEHAGSIPLELRPLIGNRIYGCDDCQLICPWNKFARRSALPDFDARAGLSGQQLVTLLAWSEDDFLRLTEGSPIRRIGHARWLRNVAVALGNALGGLVCSDAGKALDGREAARTAAVLRTALATRLAHPDAVVREHVLWALAQGTPAPLS